MIFTYDCQYFDITLHATSSSVSHGHSLAQHSFPNSNGAQLEAMGRNARTITLEFTFFGEEGLQEFERFNTLLETNEARTLVHPYLGSIFAAVSDFSHSASAETDAINCSATFVEDMDEIIFDVEPAAQLKNTTADARGATLGLDSEREIAGADASMTTSDVRSAIDNWDQNPDLPAQQVQLEMRTLDVRLAEEQNQYLGDIDLFPVYRAYTLLRRTLRESAANFTSSAPKVIDITVRGAASLRLIAGNYYGPSEANLRFAELVSLNPGVRRVGRVPRGTVLKFFAA